jgi:endonuclease/exonuclease/phosphatase family metal-dependent hydrolase
MKETPQTTKRRIRRCIFIILVLIGFILGWYAVVRLLSPWNIVKVLTMEDIQDTPHPFHASDELWVGCYNIASGRGGTFGTMNWEGGDRQTKIERVKAMARLLRDADLDIVVLNEVDFSSFWSGHVNHARIMAHEAGYPYLVEQRNVDAAIPFLRVQFGNAVLSRYPITDTTFVPFPNPSMWDIFGGDTKYGVVCTVALPDGDQIRVFPVHLTVHGEELRVASVRKILEIADTSTIPLLALGDFNAAPKGYPQYYADEHGENAIEVLLASHRFETRPIGLPLNPQDYTFPSEAPDRVIDWIFASSPWQYTEKIVVKSDLSDHFPVIARLTRQRHD